ncbi:hypothetical protein HUN08_06595 [Gordonia sp. X0973]|uniref:hypothetical protein n=1 Tax=Gordonia sp. X0973 TaxID=2742602 RepID=UPI000F52F863|nr:hypothetical protein [Gordonia sp. X0973]QKT06894.1 hypothetical protein HUN08_06595 [Gordonia sp. X0973]
MGFRSTRWMAVVPMAAAVLVLGACGTSGNDSPTSSSAPPSTPSSVPTSPAEAPVPAPVAPGNPAPAPKPQGRDDDPGGKPCTNQSGAPGHYIWSDSSNMWVCEITGDAPQQPPAPAPKPQPQQPQGRDDDPGGKPCTDQSGAPGHYIWSDSSNMWVCEITGDAPQN